MSENQSQPKAKPTTVGVTGTTPGQVLLDDAIEHWRAIPVDERERVHRTLEAHMFGAAVSERSESLRAYVAARGLLRFAAATWPAIPPNDPSDA